MANAEAPAGELAVELAWSPAPREVRLRTLRLPAGATLADALRACGWPEIEALPADGPLAAAIRGRLRPPAHPLRDGDRIEILRGLELAPMDARRERYEAAGGVKALRKRKHAMQPVKARRT